MGEPPRGLHRLVREPHRRHRVGRPDEPGQQERRLVRHHRLQHPERVVLRRLHPRRQQRTAQPRRGQRVLARPARRRLVQPDQPRPAAARASTLSLVNPSGLTRLQYAWGVGSGGGTYVRIGNAATGLYLDGMGRTANGANAGQSADSAGTNQQWVIENDGNYVRIRNRATGLYLDGMGRTTNGAAARPVRRHQQHQPAVVGADRRQQRPHQEPRHRPVRRRHGPHRQRRRRRPVQRHRQHQPAVEDRRCRADGLRRESSLPVDPAVRHAPSSSASTAGSERYMRKRRPNGVFRRRGGRTFADSRRCL